MSSSLGGATGLNRLTLCGTGLPRSHGFRRRLWSLSARLAESASDGADYSWSGIYRAAFRDGLVESVYGFELEDEDAAFAYAESLVAQRQRRLTVENRATELADRLMRSMEAHDVEGSARLAAEDFVLDDRRQLTWERQDVRKALALLFQQYNHFETRMLAVRGEKLCMGAHPLVR